MAAALTPGTFFGATRTSVDVAGVRLTELVHQSRRVPPAHAHEAAYCSWLMTGHYRERWGRRELAYTPRTVVLHPFGFEHSDEIGNLGARFLCLEFDPAWRARLDDECRQAWRGPVLLRERGLRIMERLGHDLRTGEVPDAGTLEVFALELLGEAAGSPVERARPDWVDTVVACVHANLEGPLRVGDVAAAVGRHPVHVARVLRHWTGESLGDLHLRLRVERAASLLDDRERPLADIAVSCGFSDQSHLTRAFRRVLGLTPGACRRPRA